ncbi:FAD-dependent oxidoreductase [Methylobacillus sp.]|uniref:FAD-dependent oxidoreductase n=1 Tax=Methylobacillus sp. TaxID=56818 RepID=UPI0012D13C9C|nr:FAD-dependent oxidoreductase [Methylobacillus sp.]MPS49465.1 pyridine nucleotide-disulfide oxidoreductase [Methylobacillus sp.]
MTGPNSKTQVAVIGAGPSGFYVAEAFANQCTDVEVTMIEKLPCPYGLVRYGVAPDHQKLKSVTSTLDAIAEYPQVKYLGNVTLGQDISLEELQSFFHVVVLTTGMPNSTSLGIPGEHLPGVHPATSFIGWYNGHPDFQDTSFDLASPVAVVIGHGNVAIDVARILSKSIDELRKSDMTEAALSVLAESQIKTVHLVGRRGPVQAKFTPKEIHELGKLENCLVSIDPKHLDINLSSSVELNDVTNALGRKNFSIFQEFGKHFGLISDKKQIVIDFMMKPKAFIGENKLQTVRFDITSLEGPAFKQSVIATGKTSDIHAGLAFSCVGFKGTAFPGLMTSEANGALKHSRSGILSELGVKIPGLYAAGWAKRGPQGVVGTNRECAQDTVVHIMEDIDQLIKAPKPGHPALVSLLGERNIQCVTFSDWKVINAKEIERGKSLGKPREKFTSVADMLACI